MTQTARRNLIAVRALVSDTHWIRASFFKCEGDKEVGCLIGLCRYVATPVELRADLRERHILGYAEFDGALVREMRAALVPAINEFQRSKGNPQLVGARYNIEGWNDDPDRTRDDVLTVLDKAIQDEDD